MPEYTIHAIGVYGTDGAPRDPIGVWITKEGEFLKIEHSEMPRLDDVFGAPLRFDLILKPERGGKQNFKVEVEHSFPVTITFDNDNINGIGGDLLGDPLFLVEYKVKLTAPDGSLGYGHIERSNRRSKLSNPNKA